MLAAGTAADAAHLTSSSSDSESKVTVRTPVLFSIFTILVFPFRRILIAYDSSQFVLPSFLILPHASSLFLPLHI
jgi:hypothetical protein